MKVELLLVVLAIGGLAGCSASDQEATITSERKTASRVKEDAEVAGSKTVEELKELRTDIVNGVHKLHEETIKGAAELSKKTESGAESVERAANDIQQLGQHAAKKAAEVRATIKRVDAAIKNEPPVSDTSTEKSR